jgi:hypothetical protein
MSNRTDHPIIEPDELIHLHQALTDLQESGIMNMFGAPKWLQDTFEQLTQDEAAYVFKTWTESFDE